MAYITPNQINIDQTYIDDKGGILNTLTYASAQYIYKVLERHGKENIKWFDFNKSRKIKRTIIHKNAHLDEYFAELIFRAILPPHLKDIEVLEHVLMSKEDDSYAKVSWPSGVVFGIHAEEAGSAKALVFFDEHNVDGSRIKPSCSQLVAEEYLGNNIPPSIQKVLDEVNYYDSHSGANTYNIKNLFAAMNDILFIVGKDEINNTLVTKYLTENWKRAIFGACLVAMVYVYENRLLPDQFDDNLKEEFERATKKSLDYFLKNSVFEDNKEPYYEKVKGKMLAIFHVWKMNERGNKRWHKTINDAVMRDEDGKVFGHQTLILQIVCYALNKCWGDNISKLIMMHIWQALFQQQISFEEIKNEIITITELEQKGNTKFGYIEKIIITNLNLKPEQNIKGRKRTFNLNSPLWFYNVIVTNPYYTNVAAAIKSIINSDYSEKGNNGFGILLLHDKTINSKIINNGQTFPSDLWVKLSDKILETEPECWFQLKNAEGGYADFILNRNKAHQEYLPSSLIDGDFLINELEVLC
ncbi:MAG: hypothetical protein M5R37_09310 [Melioribacteraceae bacterium]|nr:hypothetical protein [Melioribacteraceae bacterium]